MEISVVPISVMLISVEWQYQLYGDINVPISVVPISVVPISVVPITVGPISDVAISVGRI